MIKKRGNPLILFFFLVLIISIISGFFFEQKNENDFQNGTYNNTFWNSSGFIQVNQSQLDNEPEEISGVEEGLISYWRFNENSWNGTSGEVKDFLGKNNGTSVSGANTTEGLFERSGGFDGIDDYVRIPNSEEINPGMGSFTITGWAKSYPRAEGNSGQWQLYVAKRTTDATNGYYIGLNQGLGINFMIGDGTNRFDTAINGGTGYVNIEYGEWFHFAGVIERTENKTFLYINGNLEAERDFSGLGSINNSYNLTLGRDIGQIVNQNGYPVNGSVDELAFWNYSLDASEILELYEKGGFHEILTTGIYESQVIDAGGAAEWKNFSFNGGAVFGGELPDNQEYDGQINMSGNVLLMHMNELSGTIFDTSGFGNNGTQIGGVTYGQEGVYETALQFDGVDDYLSISHDSSLNLGNVLSVEAWIYPTNVSGRHVIYSTRRNNPSGSWQLEFGVGNSHTSVVAVAGVHTWVAETENNTVTLNQWNHIVYTRNGTGNTHKIYVNGQLKNLQTQTNYNFVDNSDIKLIGAGTSLFPTHFFKGKIDELAVYNRVLSEQEVLDRYNRADGFSGLKFQFRTSNDNLTWSDYKGIDGTSSSYYFSSGNLSLENSKYLQYKTFFNNLEAKFYNFTLGYDLISGILVNLESPLNNFVDNSFEMNFTCSASSSNELANITFYNDKFSWGLIEIKSVSGFGNSSIFTISEMTSFNWSCYACDIEGNCNFAVSNYTVFIDNSPPEIELISPESDYLSNSNELNFVFNAQDDIAETLECRLIIDNQEKKTNSEVLSGVNTTFNLNLGNGNYSWKINCSDGFNSFESEERNLSVDVLFSAFWAKAGLHIHTKREGGIGSDGSHSLSLVVDTYKNLGYNLIAITDHNPYGGYNNFTPCVQYNNLTENFICIESEELTLSSYHVNFINTKSAWPVSTNSLANIQNGVNDINSQGGFAFVAHPSWGPTNWGVSDLLTLQNYTGMEIYNRVIERLQPSAYAVDKWDDVLKTGRKIFGFASDDMHSMTASYPDGSVGDLGYGWVKIYMQELTNEEFVNRIKQGRFYSSQGPSMELGEFLIECDEDGLYKMGETAQCYEIKINSTISATNSSFKIQNISLIKDGNFLSNKSDCPDEQDCYFEFSHEVDFSGYYRLQAIDSNGKWIWSNPIWISKISMPVTMNIQGIEDNSNVSDYTPYFNITLNQETSLWMSVNNLENITLCNGCDFYQGHLLLSEAENIIRFYSNNSDNIIKTEQIVLNLDFNKSFEENFNDNSSVSLTENIVWEGDRLRLDAGFIEGKVYFYPINTESNIIYFKIEWNENNTENAKGEGQREPILARYKFGDADWSELGLGENWLENGQEIYGLNNNTFYIMFDFQKNLETPIELLDFKLSWKVFTIPIISDVSVSSITSGSSIISWLTDLPSNSTIYYGTTTSLGSRAESSDLVESHSLSLSGLSSSTSYFYRIISCTEASCSQDPQEPYPPYSFTTQQTQTHPSSGGSGGGGGGGGGIMFLPNFTDSILSGLNKLEIKQISNLIINSYGKKRLILEVKNSGTNFLNDCFLKSFGERASWIKQSGIKGISPGQITEFEFELDIPEETKEGKYTMFLEVECKDIKNSTSFEIELLPKKIDFNLENVKRVKANLVNISYFIKEISGIKQEVEIQFILFDSKKEKVAEVSDNFILDSNQEKKSHILMPVNEKLSGELKLLININSDIHSSFVQEDVLIGKSLLSGYTIFGEGGNAENIAIIVLLFLFILFVFFVIRRAILVRRAVSFKKRNLDKKIHQKRKR